MYVPIVCRNLISRSSLSGCASDPGVCSGKPTGLRSMLAGSSWSKKGCQAALKMPFPWSYAKTPMGLGS